mmetsp:Transcript_138011/g.440229  ORF Transcript_138011/g.440229 Transcript_138011/m.440229 type:complete len:451 (-) Transcript_138011:450-1802(-)
MPHLLHFRQRRSPRPHRLASADDTTPGDRVCLHAVRHHVGQLEPSQLPSPGTFTEGDRRQIPSVHIDAPVPKLGQPREAPAPALALLFGTDQGSERDGERLHAPSAHSTQDGDRLIPLLPFHARIDCGVVHHGIRCNPRSGSRASDAGTFASTGDLCPEPHRHELDCARQGLHVASEQQQAAAIGSPGVCEAQLSTPGVPSDLLQHRAGGKDQLVDAGCGHHHPQLSWRPLGKETDGLHEQNDGERQNLIFVARARDVHQLVRASPQITRAPGHLDHSATFGADVLNYLALFPDDPRPERRGDEELHRSEGGGVCNSGAPPLRPGGLRQDIQCALPLPGFLARRQGNRKRHPVNLKPHVARLVQQPQGPRPLRSGRAGAQDGSEGLYIESHGFLLHQRHEIQGLPPCPGPLAGVDGGAEDDDAQLQALPSEGLQQPAATPKHPCTQSRPS